MNCCPQKETSMLSRLPVILLLAASLSVFHPGLVNAADPKPDTKKPAPEKVEVQEKFIWGLVVNLVLSSAFSMFSDWLTKKLGGDPTAAGGKPLTLPSFGDAASAVPTPVGSASDIRGMLVNVAVVAITGALSGKLNSTLTRAFLGKDAPTTATPKAPLQIKDGDPNYQAAHIAILAVDAAGNVTGFRSVKEGFRTGDGHHGDVDEQPADIAGAAHRCRRRGGDLAEVRQRHGFAAGAGGAAELLREPVAEHRERRRQHQVHHDAPDELLLDFDLLRGRLVFLGLGGLGGIHQTGVKHRQARGQHQHHRQT